MWPLTRGFRAQSHNPTRGMGSWKRSVLSMSVQVKVECEGVGQRSHDAWPVGTFKHSPVVDWLRLDETDEENGWFLPEGRPMRHEWARNAPVLGTRSHATAASRSS